jgi:hypothetical protein
MEKKTGMTNLIVAFHSFEKALKTNFETHKIVYLVPF